MSETDSDKTIYLKDYQAPRFLVESIALIFRLEQECTRVTSRMRLRRAPATAADAPLELHGRQLKLLSVTLDGKVLNCDQYQVDTEYLTLNQLPENFELEILTEINPLENTSLDGLYASGSMLCTQCEPHGFSRITYFLDRPDVLTSFTTRIVADKTRFPVLLSNGNLIETGDLPENRHFVLWEDPFKKPAYLFALVAGQLVTLEDSFTTISGREIAIHFHVEDQNQLKCGHAIKALKKAMHWDEEEYGLEYDLDLYQVVAVDDFNFGAMENKGLNIFNSKYVLALPESATDGDYEAIERVIAHEYLHNWSGNRVTCRDWFQLSLKEGLTVFRDQQYGAYAYPGGGGRIRDVSRLRSFQFPEDAGPLAHPVQPKEYVEINNFYTTTVYEKGAEIIRMLGVLLGEEGFKQGLKIYFARHDGEAVTIEDLLAAMSDATDCNLRQFKLWYDQAGTPEVKITQSWQSATSELILHVTQDCPSTPQQTEKLPLHIPLRVALLDSDGKELDLILADDSAAPGSKPVREQTLEIRERESEFRFQHLPQKPVPSLLRGFSAPVKLKYNYEREELSFLAACDHDSFSRWEAAQKLMLLEIIDLLENHNANPEPQRFSQTFGNLISRKWAASEIDGICELLQLPGEIYIGEQLEKIDPQTIFKARQQFKRDLAQRWAQELEKLFLSLRDNEDYQPRPQDMARRRLKNSALDYLVTLGANGPAQKLCQQQYQDSDNLTDRLAALSGLMEISPAEEVAELDDFFKQGESTPLLLDRWFALQALSKRPDTCQRVAKLTNHTAFTRTNPNRVRALLGSFALANQSAFHQIDGSGYRILSREIITLDRTNPQLAARLAGHFSRWQRLANPYSSQMRKELLTLAKHPQISKDLGEIVRKSLQS